MNKSTLIFSLLFLVTVIPSANAQIFNSSDFAIYNIIDYGLDTDGNGLYNYLAFEAQVEIYNDKSYELYNIISSSTPTYNKLSIEKEVYLSKGNQTLYFNFSGEDLSLIKLENSDVARISFGSYMKTIELSNYSLSEFESTNIKEEALDFDNDSLIDKIGFKINLNVPFTGNYYFDYGLMANATGEPEPLEIDDFNDYIYLVQGENEISLNVSGIYANMLNLVNFTIYLYLENLEYKTNNPDNGYALSWPVIIEQEENKSVYSYSMFEGATMKFKNVTGYGIDRNNDLLWDTFITQLNVEVFEEGDYSFEVDISGDGGNIKYIENKKLYSGNQSVEFSISGNEMYLLKSSQIKTNSIHIKDITRDVAIQKEPFPTLYFNNTLFNAPPLVKDIPVDYDGDGFYDVVLIDLGLDAEENGAHTTWFRVKGTNTPGFIHHKTIAKNYSVGDSFVINITKGEITSKQINDTLEVLRLTIGHPNYEFEWYYNFYANLSPVGEIYTTQHYDYQDFGGSPPVPGITNLIIANALSCFETDAGLDFYKSASITGQFYLPNSSVNFNGIVADACLDQNILAESLCGSSVSAAHSSLAGVAYVDCRIPGYPGSRCFNGACVYS